MKRIFTRWLPPVIWMIFIFLLSAHHKVVIGQVYWQDVVIKKAIHMLEYAVLYFLFFRAVKKNKSKKTDNADYITSLFLTLAYAFLDEIHQTFVPTREGVIRDVGIDSIGILLMLFYIKTSINKLRYLL